MLGYYLMAGNFLTKVKTPIIVVGSGLPNKGNVKWGVQSANKGTRNRLSAQEP
jgi:hypothetical protein